MLRRLLPGLVAGVAIALLGMLAGSLPGVLRLEENLGLSTLFTLRGPRPSPPEVLVVSLDKASSDAFGLPNEPDEWPRRLHAELIERLVAAGARVIAFDVFFDDPAEPADDARLGEAIGTAGNVVLTAYLRKTPLAGNPDAGYTVSTETLVPPLPVIGGGALAVAPFPLPVVPDKVSQFWTYKASAGDLPTLPAIVFQAWMLRESGRWLEDLREFCPAIRESWPATAPETWRAGNLTQLARDARQCVATDRAAARAVQDRWVLRLAAGTDLPDPGLASLFRLYFGADTRYLNYYGAPRTVITIPYHQALDGNLPDLRGKLVFVGFSEQYQPEQKDSFISPFSDDTGLHLSGVEIAATAVANMVDGSAVRPLELGPQLLVVGLWGLLAGAFCRLLVPVTAVLFSVAAVPLYAAGATWLFGASNAWLPLVTPLGIQLPIALLVGLLAQYRQSQGQRRRVMEAIGVLLPPAAVKRLMANVGDLKANADLLHATCLATDVENYTTLSEELDPSALADLMNEYYDALFAEVKAAGGVVIDVTGDSMLAIWAAAAPDAELHGQACRGALAVAAAVARFNALPGHRPLPTRIGLHSGPIRLGGIGGAGQVQFRATGDIVNTTSRIEGLNKILGTRLLVSADTLRVCTGLVTRDLGTFLLAGKATPIGIHELAGTEGQVSAATLARHAEFAAALAIFHAGDHVMAGSAFDSLLARLPGDGPARFYRDLCHRYLADGPPVDAAVVRIAGK